MSMRVLYHAITESTGAFGGRNYSCSDYVAAGFNTLHFWEGQALARGLQACSTPRTSCPRIP